MTKNKRAYVRRFWTDAEVRMLCRLYANTPTQRIAAALDCKPSRVYAMAAKLGLKKSAQFMRASLRALGIAMANSESRKKHRFVKGSVPANKGLRRPGWAPGRMKETQFKPGRKPEEARNYRPIGSLRVVHGNLERKVTDDQSVYPAKRWRPVHRLVWEAAHGPVPAGHIVIFKPGMHTVVETEITIDRIELVSHAENLRRNSIHNLPAPIVDALHAIAQVKRRINHDQKHHGSSRGDVRRARRPEER
jgi:hypothetical protein